MSAPAELRRQLVELLRFTAPTAPRVQIVGRAADGGFERQALRYRTPDGDAVGASLLRPEGDAPFPGVVVHHQHNSEWHLGKSEVTGLAGDPLQAFGPALAARGVVVLAIDQLGFEDRCIGAHGTEVGADDWLEYYNWRCG